MSILLAATQRLIITLLTIVCLIPLLFIAFVLLVFVFVGIVPELIEVMGG